jgi:hypothetical protein
MDCHHYPEKSPLPLVKAALLAYLEAAFWRSFRSWLARPMRPTAVLLGSSPDFLVQAGLSYSLEHGGPAKEAHSISLADFNTAKALQA